MAEIKKPTSILVNIFIASVFCSSLVFTHYTLDYTLVPRFIMLSVSLSLLLLLLILNKNKLFVDIDLICLGYGAFTLFSFLTIFWTQNRAETIFESCRQFLFFLVFILAAKFYKANKKLFFGGVFILVIALIIICIVVAVCQFLQMNYTDHNSLYQITGINSHRNLFSGFLFLMLLFSSLAITEPTEQQSPKIKFLSKILKRRNIAIVASVVVFVLIALLQTRSVWAGIIATVCTFLFLTFVKTFIHFIIKKVKVYILIISSLVLINIVFLFVVPPVIKNSINNIPKPVQGKGVLNTETAYERLIIWDKTYCMVGHHRVAGVGSGNWQVFFPDCGLSGFTRADEFSYTCQRPHNDFLWILSETGIIGFNLYILFLSSILFFLIKASTKSSNPKELHFIKLLLSFILGYFVFSFFDFPKERIEHGIWISIALGITYSVIKEKQVITSIKVFSLNKIILIPFLALALFVVMTGYFRFVGENCTIRMYLYKAQKKPAKIILSGQQALSYAYNLDPTSIPINWYVGNAYALSGNYNEALKHFNSAYQANPYNKNVLTDLGTAYSMNGNNEAAKKYYFEAARISPAFDEPKLNLVALFLNENNILQAEGWLNSVTHESERKSIYRTAIENIKSKNNNSVSN